MSSDVKNEAIRQTVRETRLRRGNMQCKTFEVKVDASKLNRQTKADVNALFREAKWRRNDIVADVNAASRSSKTAAVKVGDVMEERSFTVLGSQMIQDIYDGVHSEIQGLSTKKDHGDKVGALRFKSVCNCVPLRQFGNTYKINFATNRIKVVNIKQPFKVRGLQQIPVNAELANAVFLRRADGLYFHITCYVPWTKERPSGKQCGIDFGIDHNLTLNNGKHYDICVPESKGVKLASRRLNRALKKNGGHKGKRHARRKQQLQRAYQKDRNRRMDKANKAVHDLLGSYDFIAIQDEMIHAWHSGLFGKQVQHSAMGTIKMKLKLNSKTFVVDKSFPSTQICPVCGEKTKHPLSKRDYTCAYCGYYHPDRDEKSAGSILTEAIQRVSTERRTKSSGEVRASADTGLPVSVSRMLRTREAQTL